MTTEHLNYCKKLKRRKLAIRLAQIGILFLFFGIWELVAALEWIDPFIISSPSRMASTLAGLILVLSWVIPYIYDLFLSIRQLFSL